MNFKHSAAKVLGILCIGYSAITGSLNVDPKMAAVLAAVGTVLMAVDKAYEAYLAGFDNPVKPESSEPK